MTQCELPLLTAALAALMIILFAFAIMLVLGKSGGKHFSAAPR